MNTRRGGMGTSSLFLWYMSEWNQPFTLGAREARARSGLLLYGSTCQKGKGKKKCEGFEVLVGVDADSFAQLPVEHAHMPCQGESVTCVYVLFPHAPNPF